MLPMLGRKLVEGEEGLAILLQTIGGLGVFGFIGLEAAVKGVGGRGLCGGQPDVVEPSPSIFKIFFPRTSFFLN